jgi:autotransporter-associated beta strand protein
MPRALLAVSALIVCLATPIAFGADYTWSGGGADNRWNTAANWLGGVTPSFTSSAANFNIGPTFNHGTAWASDPGNGWGWTLQAHSLHIDTRGDTRDIAGTSFLFGQANVWGSSSIVLNSTAPTDVVISTAGNAYKYSGSYNYTLTGLGTWDIQDGAFVVGMGTAWNGGNIHGTGGIIKTGSGLLYLAGFLQNDAWSDYSGGTWLQQGLTRVNYNPSLGTGNLYLQGGAIASGGWVDTPAHAYQGGVIGILNDVGLANTVSIEADTAFGVAGDTGSLSFTGIMNLTATNLAHTINTKIAFNNTISESRPGSNLTVAGGGTLTLGAAAGWTGASDFTGVTVIANTANTFAGTTVNLHSGKLQQGAANGLGLATDAPIIAGDAGNVSVLTLAGDLVRNVTVLGGASGTTTFGGLNTAGTVNIATAISQIKPLFVTAAAGGTVNFTGGIHSPLGASPVTKIGEGTVIFSGVNDFAGDVTITAGTLDLQTAVAGAITVGSAGKLVGHGNVGGVLFVNGTFAAGDAGVGAFTALNSATFGAGSSLDVFLGPGACNSLAVTGDFTIDPAARLNITALGAPSGGSYTFATFTGSLTGAFDPANITGLPPGATVLYDAHDITLAVPEPATLGLLVIGAASMLTRRRHREA